MASVNTQKVNERLALAEEAAKAGNFAAAVNYAQAASAYSRSAASNTNIANIVAAYSAAGTTPAATPSGGDDTGGRDTSGGSAPVPQVSTYTPPPAAFSALQLMENTLRNALGVEGLGSWAAGLYNRGASPVEIIQALRYGTDTSPEGQAARQRYLEAFPKIDEFIKSGIFSGENPELQYISYRNTVSEAAQRYGIDEALITKDKIASYIGNRTSAAELSDRMSQAATAVATTPVETISILRDYYGVQNGDLISFYLDPETTEATLQKRYTSARIGTEAMRQQFAIDVNLAEDLAMRGVTVSEAEAGFGTARRQAVFTQGRGETATQRALIGAQFGEEESRRQIERIAKSRGGEFQQGGGYSTTQQGVAGLGTASTT